MNEQQRRGRLIVLIALISCVAAYTASAALRFMNEPIQFQNWDAFVRSIRAYWLVLSALLFLLGCWIGIWAGTPGLRWLVGCATILAALPLLVDAVSIPNPIRWETGAILTICALYLLSGGLVMLPAVRPFLDLQRSLNWEPPFKEQTARLDPNAQDSNGAVESA